MDNSGCVNSLIEQINKNFSDKFSTKDNLKCDSNQNTTYSGNQILKNYFSFKYNNSSDLIANDKLNNDSLIKCSSIKDSLNNLRMNNCVTHSLNNLQMIDSLNHGLINEDGSVKSFKIDLNDYCFKSDLFKKNIQTNLKCDLKEDVSNQDDSELIDRQMYEPDTIDQSELFPLPPPSFTCDLSIANEVGQQNSIKCNEELSKTKTQENCSL